MSGSQGTGKSKQIHNVRDESRAVWIYTAPAQQYFLPALDLTSCIWILLWKQKRDLKNTGWNHSTAEVSSKRASFSQEVTTSSPWFRQGLPQCRLQQQQEWDNGSEPWSCRFITSHQRVRMGALMERSTAPGQKKLSLSWNKQPPIPHPLLVETSLVSLQLPWCWMIQAR